MKRKATSFHFGWRWSPSLKGGCKLESPSFVKQDFRYKSILTYRVWDHGTYSEILQAAQHSQGHRSGTVTGWNRAVAGTHLCARPRHIAAISREGRPVMSPSICERIPLISSVTIGLCIQLKFSFSCSVEINGPKSGTTQRSTEVLLHFNGFSPCNLMITQVSSIFDAQGSDTPSSPHS